MSTVEVSVDDFKDIMDALPNHLKDKLTEFLKINIGDKKIERVRRFCENYNGHDGIDGIIANTCACLIDRIGHALYEEMKKGRKQGKNGMCGTIAGKIVAEKLRAEADDIMKAVGQHEDERCTSH